MTEYPAGTVAVATVRGVKGVRVFRTLSVDLDHNSVWRHEEVEGSHWSRPTQVSDIRPLVVLDLPGITGAEVASHLRQKGRPGYCVCDMIADQIEAQTKPPRIPEPGRWGVVEASREGKTLGQKFLRKHSGSENGGYDWVSFTFGARGESFRWDDLINPTLVREGVDA